MLHDLKHDFLWLVIQPVLDRDGLEDERVVILSDSTVWAIWTMLPGAPRRRVPVIVIGPMPVVTRAYIEGHVTTRN